MALAAADCKSLGNPNFTTRLCVVIRPFVRINEIVVSKAPAIAASSRAWYVSLRMAFIASAAAGNFSKNIPGSCRIMCQYAQSVRCK